MTVFQQQHILAALGFHPGYFDGLDGPKTQAARELFHGEYGAEATAENLIAALSGELQKFSGEMCDKGEKGECGDVGALIWDKLKAAGLTDAGAAGVLGNLMCESAMDPKNLENQFERKLGLTDAEYTAAVDAGAYNFIDDGAGYGLCQWTYWSRKKALLAFARSRGESVGNADMQGDFILKELRELFPDMLLTLQKTQDVQAASDIFMVRFENPADKSQRAKNIRAGYAEQMLQRYAGR